MKNEVRLPIPAIRALNKLGKDIGDARRRRRITLELMAERTGLSRTTVSKIEHGSSTTSLGAYASVLFVLGMINKLENMVDFAFDTVGHQLEEERLPKRVRLPSIKKISD